MGYRRCPHGRLRFVDSGRTASAPAPSDTRPLGARWCVYYGCRREAALQANVLGGDADFVSNTDNPLCARHAEQVIACWVRELLAGGPTMHLSIARAIDAGSAAPPLP